MAAIRKGRGAVSARDGRFARQTVTLTAREAAQRDEVAAPTALRALRARSIVSKNTSPDIPFDRSINPYQGCEHGCIYCYARPTHSYLDLSPGLDFETQIFYKENAVERLVETWRRPAYRCRPITIGANTDPYQPAEKHLQLTRRLLQCFAAHRHPVNLITKSHLVVRDLELLAGLAADKLCSVAISIPTLDSGLKRRMEPRVPAAARRLEAMRRLTAAGVPVSLLLAPVIPAINDGEIETIVAAAAEAGACSAGYILLRLPHEVGALFDEWLRAHYPQRADHVLSLLRQAAGGKLYDARYGVRQTGRGAYARLLGRRFEVAASKNGLAASGYRRELDCSHFRRPAGAQLELAL